MISKEEINAALGKGLTQEQLDALHNARVAVVGLGGLGSNIAVALTRLGIAQLYLYDFDRVELSNLNRQYYFLDDIGHYKADALVKHLLRIPALLGDCDIICEALDDASSKAMLVSTVLSTWSDKKIIAGSGIAGFGKAEEITSKKIRKNLYLCGDGSSDFHDLPLCGARVALCAMQQALLAARIILDLEEN